MKYIETSDATFAIADDVSAPIPADAKVGIYSPNGYQTARFAELPQNAKDAILENLEK